MAVPVRISVTVNAVRARRELTGIVGAVRSLGRLRAPRLSVDTQAVRGAARDYAALGREARESLAKVNAKVDEYDRLARNAYGTATAKLTDYSNTASRTVGRLKAVAVATVSISAASQAIRGVAGYLKTAVGAASDLNETTSKTKVIFGDGAGSIIAFAKTADRNLGLSQQAALEASSGFGDMFRQLGFGVDQATKLSKSTLQVAADLGSFSNVDVATVADSIASAYRGEMDSLQRLIPNISAARVETEALALSHKRSAKELTAQDKALAVNAIIVKDSARAQGDFARTSGGLANVMRANQAGVANLSATIGTALLPGVTALAIAFRDKVLPALNVLVSQYAPKVNAFFTDIAKNGFNASADLGQSFAALKSIGTSLTSLGSAGGSGLADTLTVTGIAMSVLADHADLLAKAMPFLIAGFVAYKAAVLAANVAQLANLPMKAAEIAVNRQLIRSNQQLIASRAGVTTATIAGTEAEAVGTAAKSRGVIATVASRAAALAAATATGVVTAAQWLWNAALAANPLGLVVIGIAALVAGLVIAWKKSDTFRRIVTGAFNAVKAAASAAFGWVRDHWKLLAAIITGPVGAAVIFLVSKRKAILGFFTGLHSSVVNIFKGIGGVIVGSLKSAINAMVDLVNLPIKAVNRIAGKIPGVPELPEIPKLASGGIVTRPTLALIGESGPEAIVPLSGKGFGTTIVHLHVGQIVSNDPDEVYRQLARKLRRDGPGLLRAS